MTGQTVSHYRVLQKLGAGGMGEVYEAEDTVLGRRVALKFLPENLSDDRSATERFMREARASSKMNHPNICTIYDVDVHDNRPFMVMELLEGETLKDRLQRGPLLFENVLHVGIHVAEALQAAHEMGIVHRDIKPGNIFITNRAQVKVLDFGLAKLTRTRVPRGVPVGAGDDQQDQSLTALGLLPGTAYYMSPEQVRGDELDERSDIFSLGVVLYEMATGQKPFAGKTSPVTLAAILDDKPVSPLVIAPELPHEFEVIVARALEKDRNKRFRTVAELKDVLEQLKRSTETGVVVPPQVQPTNGTGRPPQKVFTRVSVKHRYIQLGIATFLVLMMFVLTLFWVKRARRASVPMPASNSVAVLPFQNVANDPASEYLRFALADEVSTILTYTPSVEVRPVPAGKFNDNRDNAERAGRELKVAYVVTGHFVREATKLIISMQVVNVSQNKISWQGTFNVAGQDFLSMQKQLAGEIRKGLLPALGGASSSAMESATRPTNPQAYDLYLRSISVPHDPGPNEEAITMLERSVGLDPGYAPAWDSLGLRYYYQSQYAGGGAAAFDRAVAAYERATALDPNYITATAHIIRAHVERGELALAYVQAQDLVKQRPDNVQAHFTLSYVLRYAGVLTEAGRECNEALRLDPGNYGLRSCAFAFMEQGDVNRAMTFVNLDSGSNFATNVTPPVLLRGNDAESYDAARNAASKMSNDNTWFGGVLQSCLNGQTDTFAKLVNDSQKAMLAQRDPEFRYFQGSLLAFCGERVISMQLLRSAVDANYCAAEAFENDPALNRLRDMPDFDRLTVRARVCERDAVGRPGMKRPTVGTEVTAEPSPQNSPKK